MVSSSAAAATAPSLGYEREQAGDRRPGDRIRHAGDRVRDAARRPSKSATTSMLFADARTARAATLT